MIYDLIVIGGGPAGYFAAEKASHAGLKTLLIEKDAVGGVCLNEGCIPTKTLLYSAKVCDQAKQGHKYGVIAGNVKLDHQAVIGRKNKVISMLGSGIMNKLKKNGVTFIEEYAQVIGKSTEGFEVKTGQKTHVGKTLLLAAGSIPVIPSIPGMKAGVKNGYVVTNKEILKLDVIPSSLVIIGGGVVGLEMASYFNSAGSQVTVIEMRDNIAGDTDADIIQILMKNYQRKGIEFKLKAKVTAIGKGSVTYEQKGQMIRAQADKILISVGRKPAIEGLGLECIGLRDESGCIRTDEKGETDIKGVYAAGDINSVSMLAHTAYREAAVCANNILGKNDRMEYDTVPWVIYTNPEVAGVGETEASAQIKGIANVAFKLPMAYSGRYVAENEVKDGICKVVINKDERRIIGLHMIGNYASEIIYGAALIIKKKMTLDQVEEMIFPHPTVSEIIRETAIEFSNILNKRVCNKY